MSDAYETLDSGKKEAIRGLIQRCIKHFPFFAEKQLKIATKEGAIKSFKMNQAQHYVHERLEEQLFEQGQIRALILKGRQQGISTYVEGRFYWKTRFRKAVNAFILTHLQDSTDALFNMVKRYHDELHDMLRPATKATNSKELKFAHNGSSYAVSTAKSKATGRGRTLHYFHGSEVAFWDNAETHAAGALQAVPKGNDTEVIFESTANGIGGYFHELWQKAMKGESQFIAIFLPWFWQGEYRSEPPAEWKPSDVELETAELYGLDDEQLYWAHQKNIELGGDVGDWGWLFLQEYPFCAADAFQSSGQDTLCAAMSVTKARKRKDEEVSDYGAHLIGVDPARYGKDRASWIHRKGARAWGLQSLKKCSTTQLAGRIAAECDRYAEMGQPVDAILCDETGVGGGTVDALRDMGYKVIGVNAGGKALDDERYYNMRASFWHQMAEWLDGSVSIPDSDSLHADLIAPEYTHNVKGQIVVETKEQMAKRGIRSPDEAEALGQTFAVPVKPQEARSGGRRRRAPRDWRSM